jgi:hypothetical protein
MRVLLMIQYGDGLIKSCGRVLQRAHGDMAMLVAERCPDTARAEHGRI